MSPSFGIRATAFGVVAAMLAPTGSNAMPRGLENRDFSDDGSTLTYVTIPATNSIQTDLVSTFPTGIFKSGGKPRAKFSIPAMPLTCGYTQAGPCNFYDAFTYGASITINVSISGASKAFTLMNAYSPPVGEELATIEFVGSKGATVTFPLIGGEDIRDFYQGDFANTLNNGVAGVTATNAFACDDPTNCLGGSGTGNVTTGEQGTYNLDQQEYDLGKAFHAQTLQQIKITQVGASGTPLLLGLTVKS